MADHYLATEVAARAAVARLVERWNSGEFPPEVGFDLETSPLKSLVAYPGTRWGQVKGENGQYELGIIKPDKKEYLMYAQKIWAAHFNPWLLYNLGLFLPTKFTTGKEEDGRTAGEAWQLFHDRLLELSDEQILSSGWTRDAFEVYIQRKKNELSDLERTYRFCDEFIARGKPSKEEGLAAFTLFPSLKQYTKNQTFTIKAAETAQKKLSEQIDALSESIKTLTEEVNYHFESPIDVKILRHVVNVAVEGRIKVNSGRNGLDPVKPGLDPHTSEVFLAQFTFYTKENECENYIFNHHAYDYSVVEPLLVLENALYIGANIKFDLGLTMIKLGDKYKAPMNVYCTQVASRMLYLGIDVPHNLAAVAKRFLKRDISKEVRDTFIGRWYAEPTSEQLEYASLDTEILRPLYLAQQRFAEKHGQVELIRTFSKLSWVSANMESRGYCIDEAKWLGIAAGEAQKRDEFAHQLTKMLLPVGELDLSSEDDDSDEPVLEISQKARVAELLPALLDMDIVKLFKDGKISLKKENLELIEREYVKKNGVTHDFFLTYKKWSKAQKAFTTYGKRFLWYVHPLTGKIHPRFIIAGTDTGRFTSTSPNFLQIPAGKEEGDADFRSAFIPDEGYYLVGADYNSAEWVIAACWSEDPMLGKLFSTPGADPHKFTAVLTIYVKKEDVSEVVEGEAVWHYGTSALPIKTYTVPKSWTDEELADFALSKDVQAGVGKLQRTVSKATGFGYLFGSSAFGMATKSGLPQEQCQGFLDAFAGLYSTLHSKREEVMDLVFSRQISIGDKKYAWAPAFCGLRRYSEMPHNPHPQEYNSYDEYTWAAKEYKRQIGGIQRELFNIAMQGGNAVITAEALVKMAEEGREKNITPFLSIYDENLIVAPLSVSKTEAADFLERCMVEPAHKYTQFCPLGAEVDREKLEKTKGAYWVKS